MPRFHLHPAISFFLHVAGVLDRRHRPEAQAPPGPIAPPPQTLAVPRDRHAIPSPTRHTAGGNATLAAAAAAAAIIGVVVTIVGVA